MRVTLLAGLLVSLSLDLTAPFRVNLSPKPHSSTSPSRSAVFPAVRTSPLFLAPVTLPDSLADSARIAAESTLGHFERSPASSCRIDFYTNVGDEVRHFRRAVLVGNMRAKRKVLDVGGERGGAVEERKLRKWN